MRCLVTGATGYLGGRLVPRLLAEGHEVRCLVRDPGKLRDVPWASEVEVVRGDVLDASTLSAAVDGIDVVHYLVHSLNNSDFADADRKAAENTARAAERARVKRIVYLGGLHPEGGHLSPHLASRKEVGDIFLASGVPAVVFQAAVIIGSGSASFEMLRYLSERLPVMVAPRWVHNRIQPIAVRDVLRYLVEAVSLPDGINRTFDIGGPDVLTYEDMMVRYARVARLLPRKVVGVPFLTPKLSSHWVNLITPVPRSIAAPLIESLVHEVVCREDDVLRLLPGPTTGYDRAVELALAKIMDADVETRWSNASLPGAPSDPLPTDPDWSGGSSYADVREQPTKASPQQLWAVVEGIGGEHGWYSFPLAWAVRGWLDRLAGGVGLRRGRRDPRRLHVGEALDWWRVEEIERGRLLRLRAEMRVPGLAWLELQVSDDGEGGSTYRQRAVFVPRGLAGHLYWWAVWPFHGLVFGGMVRNITSEAELTSEFRKS
ncbi:SDR family oxidoreductase [Actinosynnema sp. NPDC047251]|uniref:NmrA family protein n=1 Tax=Saccharothrix espanaensis (strain ATCC 51144 / DSM 44229 / JCM 9112 / NBRC 15066 / NRRL 15764) TaxID=1179773 RepID=K0KBX8_SACES|nr:SDR family oxidoreductase [Saccharothrix espanaensis]CCH35706.1 NmrA family protein [Saccharothrix espanaensis DSM 44229]